MAKPTPPKNRFRAIVVALAAVLMVVASPGVPGFADPTNPDGPPNTLEEQITDIGRKLADAQDRMTKAQQQRAELQTQVNDAQKRLDVLTASIGQMANAQYRTGGVATLNALLSAPTPSDFVQRFSALHEIAQEQNAELVELHQVQADFTQKQAALNQQIAIANTQTVALNQQKQAALKILNHAQGGPTGVVVPPATASAAPRNPDGSFPAQSCTQKDPTNPSGCLTARTLHAYQEVKKAGFNHYVHCWREQSWGEHPKGRACDWAAATTGFEGVATGSERDYGNKLAGWLIGNADRLGVLYVIWFHMIWLPGVGWHKYTTEGGDPSGDHTNHVHMSIR